MTKTKLLLTGLLAGAVAFGTACKTDKGATGTGTDTTTMGTDAGTGGAGYETPDRREEQEPLPEEGTREMEPGVHEGSHEMPPGTGGTGLENEPFEETDRPDSPATKPLPDEEEPIDDEGTREQPRE
jgi:hypothetical protein